MLFGVANATVLDFDNITSLTQPDTPVDLLSYGGLEWTNSQVVEEGWMYAGTSYYVNSAVSGDYAFVSNSGLVPVTVSMLSGKFNFMGAYFTPADINNAGDIFVEAFLGTNSQGSQTIDLALSFFSDPWYTSRQQGHGIGVSADQAVEGTEKNI